MIHNTVTDKNGDEHQAVKSNGACVGCSLNDGATCRGVTDSIKDFECEGVNRKDGAEAIYKRRIKIGDVKR